MKKNWLGDIENIRARNISSGVGLPAGKQALFNYIREMRNEGFSYGEIQSALQRAGVQVDETTIRLASSK